ncbi:MAG: hypothetical protein R6X18_20295, partial [Chloroflexota bacterium]
VWDSLKIAEQATRLFEIFDESLRVERAPAADRPAEPSRPVNPASSSALSSRSWPATNRLFTSTSS